MRSNYHIKLLSTVFLLGMFIGPARADLILSFSESNVTLAVGQSVDIDIVLTQNTPAISGADIRTNGIILADIELLLSSSSASVTALGYGPGFENGSSSLAAPRLSAASIDSINGVTAPAGDPTSITLGTFTFTANSVGTTNVTTVDTSFTDFFFATDPPGPHGPDIDSLIFGSESVIITAVPEVSLLTLWGPLSACAVTFRRRRSNLD